VPVAILGLDLQAGPGQERPQRRHVQEAQAGVIDPQDGAVGVAGRLGERHHVADHPLDLVPDAQPAPNRVHDLGPIRRVPVLPGVRLWVARLEREPTTLAQRRPDRDQRRTQLVVVDQALERVADHGGQVEPAVPDRFGGHAATHSMSVRRRARSSIARSGSSPTSRPGCPVCRAWCSMLPVPQPRSRTASAAINKSR